MWAQLIPEFLPESSREDRRDKYYEAEQAQRLVEWLGRMGRRQMRRELSPVRRVLASLVGSMVPIPEQVIMRGKYGNEILAGYARGKDDADGGVLTVLTWGGRTTRWTAEPNKPDVYRGIPSSTDDAGGVLYHMWGLHKIDALVITTGADSGTQPATPFEGSTASADLPKPGSV